MLRARVRHGRDARAGELCRRVQAQAAPAAAQLQDCLTIRQARAFAAQLCTDEAGRSEDKQLIAGIIQGTLLPITLAGTLCCWELRQAAWETHYTLPYPRLV